MSQENVEIIRKSLESFEDDVEAWLGTIDPDHVWYPLEQGHIPSYGHEGALGIRQRWLESWEEHSVDVDEIREQGDDVVASIHIRGRGRGSGALVDLRVHMHWKLRDGKIVYLFEYADRADALEAAGLRE